MTTFRATLIIHVHYEVEAPDETAAEDMIVQSFYETDMVLSDGVVEAEMDYEELIGLEEVADDEDAA